MKEPEIDHRYSLKVTTLLSLIAWSSTFETELNWAIRFCGSGSVWSEVVARFLDLLDPPSLTNSLDFFLRGLLGTSGPTLLDSCGFWPDDLIPPSDESLPSFLLDCLAFADGSFFLGDDWSFELFSVEDWRRDDFGTSPSSFPWELFVLCPLFESKMPIHISCTPTAQLWLKEFNLTVFYETFVCTNYIRQLIHLFN